MSDWTDKLKRCLYASHQPHSVFIDGDGLCEFQELQASIRADGYELLTAKDFLDVRVQYELQLRGSETSKVLVAPPGYRPLPDIQDHAHIAVVGLADLFPNLYAPALHGLGFNALTTLANIKNYTELGEEATMKFLLENLYGIDLNAVYGHRRREGIMAAMIAVFLEGERPNAAIIEHITKLARPLFPQLVQPSLDAERLLNFLQSQWADWAIGNERHLDFSWPQLSSLVGHLFLNKRLEAVPVSKEQYDAASDLARIGLRCDGEVGGIQAMESRIAYLEEQVAQIQNVHEDWHRIAIDTGILIKDALALGCDGVSSRLDELLRKVNERFQRYLDSSYHTMFSLSGARRPYIITRVQDHLASQPQSRKALIVLDGIAFWQWQIMADALAEAGLSTHTGATLAYIPTITAWSRQALFRGGRPDLSETNAHENQIFTHYWEARGLRPGAVQFARFSVSQPFTSTDVNSGTQMLALVCNDLDDIAHGVLLGWEQLYTATSQWIAKAGLVQLVKTLKELNFSIFLTTDHGNIAARGIGALKVADKVGAISRSKRHAHFSSEILRDGTKERFSGHSMGQAELSLYLRDESAFVTVGQTVITHGGSHFCEVLIPFASV